MKPFTSALLVAAFALSPARADDAGAHAVLDKAIKALGGEEKLAKASALTWKAKGKITFNDNTNEFTSHATVRGLDHYRSEFEGEFNGNPIKGVTVLNGDKGWRKFGDNFMKLEGDMLENEKRSVYLQVIPTVLVPLKGKGFKVESAAEQNVDGKPAAALKATGPDGKDFTIYFDKESGLPVKQVATVVGFGGEEYTQETTLAGYKEFDGIKKATKVESKRNGEKFVEIEISEFSVPDKVDDDTFAEPQ
ncbi:MAG: hypothetical protein P4L84_05805 [Isosphaeraceae bacterium]|nr:hypothetical protein [Isosphaeraceae bacterium]